LLPAPALAQLVPQRQWAVFRQTDGLLSNDVFSILVDDDAIWFGTDKGVNRYDGKWRSFPISLIANDLNRNHERSLPGRVTALAKAAHGGGIWLATDSGYVARWDGGQWQPIAMLDSAVQQLVDLDGILWIATAKGLHIYANGFVRTVAGFSTQTVYEIVAEGEVVWVGSDSGLWRLTRGATDPEKVPVAAADTTILDAQGMAKMADIDPAILEPLVGPVEALWSDGAGSLWLGSGSKVVQFDPLLAVGRSFEPFAQEEGDLAITGIAGTPGERVWIASDGGGVVQFMFDDGLLSAANNLGSSSEGGLDTDVVRALVVDGDNTLWFASSVGVFRYQLWAWLETDSRLDGLVVNDLLHDHAGGLWVATGGEGVQWRQGLYAHPTTFYPSATGLPSEFINDLEEDAAGAIWAGTAEGLARYTHNEWEQPLAPDRLPTAMVKALQADEQGLWIGTTGGLVRYEPQSDALTIEPQFAGHAILRLARDSAGRLWVAAQDGLWVRSEDGAWRQGNVMGAHPPGSEIATALLPDPSQVGGMYVAYLDGGIYRWNGVDWENVDRHHWTRGDRIYTLAIEPSSNNLWIGSDIGLSRLDLLSLVTYDSHDGMQNGAVRAIVADPAGGYWFGGQKGLSFYEQETTPPWIQVNGINSPGMATLADGWQVFAGQTVQAFYTVGDIQSSTEELAVFYRLNRHGVAESWRPAGTSPLALRLETPDTVDLELMVRDPSFNYSQPLVRRLAVIPPPSTVSLPLLGEIESRIFNLLLVFGGLATIGFGYVSYEIFVHNHRVSEAVRRGFNPYISGEPVRREEMFYGRHELLQRIVATLHNNSIMIHGERRIGKTTLLYQLGNALRQVEDEEYWFVPVMIDLEGTTEDKLFLQLAEDIYQAAINLPDLAPAALHSMQFLACHRWSLAEAAGEIAMQYSDREFGRDLRIIVRLLEQYAEQRADTRQVRLILLLDEVDTLSKFDPIYQQQLRRIFMRDFAATLGAVVAGIAISKEWDRVESPWFNLFNEIAMAPFSYAEAIELLVEPVRGYYIYEPAALDFIVQHSDGRPYRIQQFALEAVNHMLQHKRRRIQLCDVEYAHTQILATNSDHAAGLVTESAPPAPGEPRREAVAPHSGLTSAPRAA
jgi:ligand-binding sensor domain-containing protein